MRVLNPILQEEILDKTYITVKDIYNLYPIGRNQSLKLFNQIALELAEKGINLPICRPKVIPLGRILKIYPIDEKRIRNAAKRWRENGN